MKPEKKKQPPAWIVAPFAIGLALVLLVQGAIPFFIAPTMSQAFWTTGFAQSFINESIFNIYARNFGAPEPAAIVFGLAGAWPTGILIKLGLHPIEAYTTMAALWFSLAFFSAYRIGCHFSLTPLLSILGATAWCTMPIIWGNAEYSMTSIGIALLSFYLLSTLILLSISRKEKISTSGKILKTLPLYLSTCLISVFMDGYSFLMFALGSSILAGVTFIQNKKERPSLLRLALPIHTSCFTLSYYLYSQYIGKPQFKADYIDGFRALGADLSFLFIPTKGIHWIMDMFGLSTSRSDEIFFGDNPVWMSTFCAPIIAGGIWGIWKLRHERRYAIGLFLLVLFSFYMSLGPSLKINSQKPPEARHMRDMPEKYAIVPTGSKLLSRNLPGFNNMRASHRWVALGALGAWALVTLAISRQPPQSRLAGILILSSVTLTNLPNFPNKIYAYKYHRDRFYSIEKNFIKDIGLIANEGEKVAFLPWDNDFLTNYASSLLKVKSYNTGGDKNLAEARKHWPAFMSQFPMASIGGEFPTTLIQHLIVGESDLVILPYINIPLAGSQWPIAMSRKEEVSHLINKLINYQLLEIEEREYYAAIRLSPQWHATPSGELLRKIDSPVISIPMFSHEWNGVERNKKSQWRWASGSSVVKIHNYDNKSVIIDMAFSAQSLNKRDLAIIDMDEKILWESNSLQGPQNIKISSIELKPGVNQFNFKTNTPPVSPPKDRRKLAFRVIDFSISEAPTYLND